MKTPFNIRAPSFDAHAIDETIRASLAAAGLDTTSGPMRGVTDTIRRALAASGMPMKEAVAVARGQVIDVVARVVTDRTEPARAQGVQPEDVRHTADGERARRPPMAEPPAAVGTFETSEYANRAGARSYKLYVPARVGALPPLLVMLHGCTQSADDFAAGTRMNRLADEHGLLVVYPEQASGANASKCWNWFKAQDQVRDAGEPSLIAGIVREVAARHGVDTRRIFVAGLSAGAAMAVILGQTYPELFTAVGAHSGLPYRSAHDIPSAMAVMKGGRSGMAGLTGSKGLQPVPGQDDARQRQIAQAVPTIVFHGDRDHTVQLSNGITIVQQASDAHSAAARGAPLRVSTQRGSRPGGRRYSRTVHADAAGRTRVECWTVHGAGHAWAGGSDSGSCTDASGPDASAEMLRFFLAVP